MKHILTKSGDKMQIIITVNQATHKDIGSYYFLFLILSYFILCDGIVNRKYLTGIYLL